MNRKEIVNCPEYKAANAALRYWHSLPDEVRKWIINLDQEPDVIDAYEAGVLYGWNNPNWISVNDDLPKHDTDENGLVSFPIVLVCLYDGYRGTSYYDDIREEWGDYDGEVEYWMPLPQPPRKEE